MILVYITCATLDEAKSIARTAVTEKLAACANIFPQIYSIYGWKDQLCEDSEVVLILKTLESNYEKLAARVKELHSFECPCIIALDVKQVNNEYLDWTRKQAS
jgi:periplasmic divalent cation tolerance protein